MTESNNLAPPEKKQNPGKDFTQGPVHTHLIRLTGFMIMGLVSVMGANLIETVYIGNVGTNELAAISFSFPMIMLFQGISMGLGIGASSVVARTMGQGNKDKAKTLITHCFLLVVSLIILLAGIAYNFVDSYFSLVGADDLVHPLAVEYMKIWLCGLPFFTVAMVGSTLMRAMGDPKTPGLLMTIGSILHVIISPIFIFGLMGAPKLGLAGAAAGFVVARCVSFLMYAYVIIVRDQFFDLNMKEFKQSCYNILHVGLPAIASNMIVPISMAVITKILASHGTVVIAGFGVGARIESMIMMVVFALSMSAAPFIGQNWGAGLFDRVTHALKLSNRFAILWGVFAYCFFLLFAELLISLINDDPGVLEAATMYLRILPLSIGFMGLIAISTASFNALGKPMPPLLISISQMVIINIPLALLGDYLWGYVGIFIAGALTTTIMGIVSWIWITRQVASGISRRLRI